MVVVLRSAIPRLSPTHPMSETHVLHRIGKIGNKNTLCVLKAQCATHTFRLQDAKAQAIPARSGQGASIEQHSALRNFSPFLDHCPGSGMGFFREARQMKASLLSA